MSDVQKELSELLSSLSEDGFSSDAFVGDRGIEIATLEVEESCRGRGVGTCALERIAEFADANGLAVLVTPVPESVGWYRKLGYVWPKEEILCEQHDLLMMRREPEGSRPAP